MLFENTISKTVAVLVENVTTCFLPADVSDVTSGRWPVQHRHSHVVRRSAAKITNKKHYAAGSSSLSADGRCMARVQSALGDMMMSAAASGGFKNDRASSRRHTAAAGLSFGFMDLSGYALHQRLRTAPGAEMYVTGIRAKALPPRDEPLSGGEVGNGGDRSWARVDECRYDPMGNTLEARMRFGRPLMVSGSVRLLYGGNRVGGGPGETGCDMTVRLRPRAGLGFTAAPLTMPEKSPPNRLTATPTMTIRTTATFIDPEPAEVDPATAYVSVHSYNCVGGAAGFPGNRERPASASSDRFEQFLSAEQGGGDGMLSSSVGDAEFDIDLDEISGGGDLTELGDKRTGGGGGNRRPSASLSSSDILVPAAPAAPAAPITEPAPVRPFGAAGFVTGSASPPSPEPRLRRIQYHGSKPHRHPLLSAAAVAAVAANQQQQQSQDQLLMEMEEVFVRGVRSLLAKHMERTLQPVLKDSLMANMGYTVSYG